MSRPDFFPVREISRGKLLMANPAFVFFRNLAPIRRAQRLRRVHSWRML
jgi:hypothetical protein